jgi:hypothetical protein
VDVLPRPRDRGAPALAAARDRLLRSHPDLLAGTATGEAGSIGLEETA